MRIGQIEVEPIAAESLGVRSFCTKIRTPDLSILLDPSAALAFRPPHEPHPLEYIALHESLERINLATKECDILTVSHYHFDHVRPGATNQRYNLSTPEDRKRTYAGKRLLVKDGRTNINPSQRRRAYYFERDMHDIATLEFADGKTFDIGNTQLVFSHPLPHGPEKSPLGFVLATLIEYDTVKVLFAPDVQGPSSSNSLEYISSLDADLIILGGPPIYLKGFSSAENDQAFASLAELAGITKNIVVDHHLLRTLQWESWISPIETIAHDSHNEILSMATLAGLTPNLLEARRNQLYDEFPPSSEFQDWLNASDEYKFKHAPPYFE